MSLFIISSCSPVHNTRGNFVDTTALKQIKPAEMTRNDVGTLLGSPTTVSTFGDDVWYYIGQHTGKTGIFDPQIINERIVTVEFDDKGKVKRIMEMDEGRIKVPYSREKTPTYGNEITLMQNLLGNIGRFNPPQN